MLPPFRLADLFSILLESSRHADRNIYRTS